MLTPCICAPPSCRSSKAQLGVAGGFCYNVKHLELCAQRESAPDARAAWYPPVQRTLGCLSRLYRCVEHRVFAGLAQDAVSSCAAAVQALPQCTHLKP